MRPSAGEEQSDLGHPTDIAVFASIASTLQHTVLPNVDDPYARQVVIQLIGLATYAGARGPELTPDRVTELAALLDELRERVPAAAAHWPLDAPRDPATVMRAASSILTARIEGADERVASAVEPIRKRLIAHLDEDLAAEAVLIAAFRGKLPDG